MTKSNIKLNKVIVLIFLFTISSFPVYIESEFEQKEQNRYENQKEKIESKKTNLSILKHSFKANIYNVKTSLSQIKKKDLISEKATNLLEKTAYALIIGISDYPGETYDLSYCDDDALAVYNLLIENYNFKAENIIYLQDSSATLTGISNALDSIASVIKEDDIFFFYYSGHGGHNTYTEQGSCNIETMHPYWNEGDQIWSISHPEALYMRIHFQRFETEDYWDYMLCGNWGVTQGYYYEEFSGNLGYNFWSSYIPTSHYYIRFISDETYNDWGFKIDKYEAILEDGTHYLCSQDSIPNNPSSYYLDSLLNSKLDNITCKDKYVILDSCNSGGMIPEVQDIGRYIMTACRGTEESLESSELEHGVFTNYFLESYNNAEDLNQDGVVSMEECYSYIYSNTRSYSGSFGSEYRHSPQQSDNITGEAVLQPLIGSININTTDNKLNYSFILYGHGNLRTLNLTVCSIYPQYNFTFVDLKSKNCSSTGFGNYSGGVEFDEGYVAGGIKLLAEIEGNRLITINITHGDSDKDGLTDFYEINEGNGLDPTLNDTDSDGLLDGEELNIYNSNPLEEDTDEDGISDGDEVNTYGTNPSESDSDFDGLSDPDEINIHNTEPTNNDTDSDGLSDGEEVNTHETNPINADTDSDTIPDGWEIDNSLDPFTNDTSLDPDSDGLTNLEEYNHNTNPNNGDTDSDGLSDGEEVNTHETNPTSADTDSDTIPDGWEIDNSLDPLNNDTALDPDNDDLTNFQEYNYSTQPFNNDTDSDGLLDGEEVNFYNTDPLEEDSDDDGWNDGDEIYWGTDPLDPDDNPDSFNDSDDSSDDDDDDDPYDDSNSDPPPPPTISPVGVLIVVGGGIGIVAYILSKRDQNHF
jgi:hypothetical protein